MILTNETLNPDQLKQLALLHQELLPKSSLNLFGPKGVERFYAYVAAAPNETLFLNREGNEIRGAAVLTSEAATLSRRFVTLHPFASFFNASCHLVCHPLSIIRFMRTVLARDPRPTDLTEFPEVIIIFTHPKFQGRQIGSQLLGQVEPYLQSIRVGGYVVKTEDEPTNRALSFYEKNGFQKAGTSNQAGTHFVYLIKKL